MDVDTKLAEFKTSLYRIVTITLVCMTVIFGIVQTAVVKYVTSNEHRIEQVQLDIKDLDKRNYLQTSELNEMRLDISYIKQGLDRIENRIGSK